MLRRTRMREAFEGLQTACEIVGGDEVGEMTAQLVVIVVVIAFDGCVLDRAVHSFDLAVGPGMIDLGESVFDTVLAAMQSREASVGVQQAHCVLSQLLGSIQFSGCKID